MMPQKTFTFLLLSALLFLYGDARMYAIDAPPKGSPISSTLSDPDIAALLFEGQFDAPAGTYPDSTPPYKKKYKLKFILIHPSAKTATSDAADRMAIFQDI